jgi:VWFA-related protein
MRWIPALGLAAAAMAGGQEAPVFRAGTRLVEVSVTVLDRKGNAVTGLGQADFTVLDEGQPRPIAFFQWEGAPAAEAPPAAPPAGLFSNRVELAGGPPRSVTALVLDALNTPPPALTMARAQMMRYLRALAPSSRVALFQMGLELRVLHDFTDDAASLRARLEKATFNAPPPRARDFSRSVQEAEDFIGLFKDDPGLRAAMAESMGRVLKAEMASNEAARQSRREQSLAALEALGRHLAGIPGRKNLVWIGAGFAMSSSSGRGGIDSYEDAVRNTARRLAQQGITLYIVDTRGLASPEPVKAAYRGTMSSRGPFAGLARIEEANNDAHTAMNLMAAVTGGRYLYDTNDLAAGFQYAAADLRGSYTLGFYAPEDAGSGWRKLKVSVKRSGLSVRHREGYAAAAPPPSEWDDESRQAALANPLGSSMIPLTVHCEHTPAGELSLALTIGAAGLDFRPEGGSFTAELELVLADRTPDGVGRPQSGRFRAAVPADQLPQVRAQGLRASRRWTPAAGASSVRVLVRDNRSGQYGTVDVPLKRLPGS